MHENSSYCNSSNAVVSSTIPENDDITCRLSHLLPQIQKPETIVIILLSFENQSNTQILSRVAISTRWTYYIIALYTILSIASLFFFSERYYAHII